MLVEIPVSVIVKALMSFVASDSCYLLGGSRWSLSTLLSTRYIQFQSHRFSSQFSNVPHIVGHVPGHLLFQNVGL